MKDSEAKRFVSVWLSNYFDCPLKIKRAKPYTEKQIDEIVRCCFCDAYRGWKKKCDQDAIVSCWEALMEKASDNFWLE